LWQTLSQTLPANAEFETRGTIWVAADDEEQAEAARKHSYLQHRRVPSQLLSADELAVLEPNLRTGLAGGLLVPEDAVVYPPVVAHHLTKLLQSYGSEVIQGRSIQKMQAGEVLLDDGSEFRAPKLVNALGADAAHCTPGLPIKKRKGHLAITERYPDFIRHQLVELGYLKSAHSLTSDSVAFNVQPRQTGQLLIGSSRQYGNEDPSVNQEVLSAMLERATLYVPALASLKAIRIWTGFRAATPDKLPLIGPVPSDPTLWLATGHEGLGITTALATAELLTSFFTGSAPPIPAEPYLPSRFEHIPSHDTQSLQEAS